MARGKVRLAYIQNDSNRRTTYRKRKGGIVKKLDEVTTLCAIEACCIMYSIFDPQPMVWPSIEEAHRLITKFRSSSMVDQVKRKVNQETFMRQMLQKMEEKLKKVQVENCRKEITQIMYQCTTNLEATLSRLGRADFEDLSRLTKQKVIEVERMMEIRMRQESSFNPPPLPLPLPPHGGDQQLGLSHHEFMLPNQYGRFSSSRPSFNEFEFMPPNHDEMFQSRNPAFFMPNMMLPPHPNMELSLPPPQGGNQLVLSNEFEFMPPNHDERFQSFSPGFAMPNLAFPPPPMPFSLPNMDVPQNEVANMNPNIEMPYPSNQPMFPYNHSPNMPPQGPY